jgi:nucleotide-binding universal stress UspA family protein
MFQRIMVPVDGSDTSNRALAVAIDLAHAFGASLRLVHGIEQASHWTGYDSIGGGYAAGMLDAARKAGDSLLANGLAQAHAAGVPAEAMLFDRMGERLGTMVANAAKLWEADLIVVGTHGRRGLGRVLMGSGAEQIIRLAPIPTLVIRSGDPELASRFAQT